MKHLQYFDILEQALFIFDTFTKVLPLSFKDRENKESDHGQKGTKYFNHSWNPNFITFKFHEIISRFNFNYF